MLALEVLKSLALWQGCQPQSLGFPSFLVSGDSGKMRERERSGKEREDREIHLEVVPTLFKPPRRQTSELSLLTCKAFICEGNSA